MSRIGERIAELRKSRSLTQEELASTIGVSAQSISKWETGATMPDIMLLPVIADTFHVSIDTLFGKNSETQRALSPEDAFETACDALLSTIASCCYDKPMAGESYENHYQRYIKALNSDSNMRTAIVKNHGVLYYRNEVGGLMLKKPDEGWASLFTNSETLRILRLCGDELFCKAMEVIVKSNMTTFTISSLCSLCGVEAENIKILEEKINECGLFIVKHISVDAKDVAIYDLYGHKMFLVFAILMYANELSQYRDTYACYIGDGNFLAE